MAQITSPRAKLLALGGAILAALMSGDVSGYAPDLASIMRDAPIVVVVLLYVELRLLPWALPMRRYAQRELGQLVDDADAPIDLIDEATPRPAIHVKSGPVGVVKP